MDHWNWHVSQRIRRTISTAACIVALAFVLVGTVNAQQAPPTSPEATSSATAESGSGQPTSEKSGNSLVDMARVLGVWLVPFVIATLVLVWVTTERLVVLRRGRVIPKPFVERFVKHLADRTISRDEALQICEENGSPIAMVFAHGVRKWGKPSVEVEQAIIDGGERQVAALRTHLRVINGVATITPMLGLLGTVWGMFESFGDIAAAGTMGNTTVLANGISVALLTTVCGLVIAIPSMIIYLYLSGRIDGLVMEMDDLAQTVVQCISAEALASQTRPKTKAAS